MICAKRLLACLLSCLLLVPVFASPTGEAINILDYSITQLEHLLTNYQSLETKLNEAEILSAKQANNLTLITAHYQTLLMDYAAQKKSLKAWKMISGILTVGLVTSLIIR